MTSTAQLAFAIKEWWNAKSTTFSAICGEDFTHKQVIIAHAAFALFIIVCCLVEKGGAL